MKMKEFLSNVLNVVVFGCLVLFVSSFFTKELSADDSDGQGLIEQFGDQLKKLFGGNNNSNKELPEEMGGLSEYMEDLMLNGWHEFHDFTAMISVVMPNLRQMNYNTTIKIDDKTWGHSNRGVWCHSLEQITNSDNFTGWEDYPEDTRID